MSCDSVQVYRDVFIGCNKPSEEEMREVRHHLVDVASLDETFNAGMYKPPPYCMRDVDVYLCLVVFL